MLAQYSIKTQLVANKPFISDRQEQDHYYPAKGNYTFVARQVKFQAQ